MKTPWIYRALLGSLAVLLYTASLSGCTMDHRYGRGDGRSAGWSDNERARYSYEEPSEERKFGKPELHHHR